MADAVMHELISRKNEIESELKLHGDVLASHGIGMNEELTDSEGFPKPHLDIVTIRKSRVRIIYLRNDLKSVMEEIEEKLHKIHAEIRSSKTNPEQLMSEESKLKTIENLESFLKVDRVDSESPAEACGLEVNDLITQFGSITFKNFNGLQSIGTLVQNSKEKEILVCVRRDNTVKKLRLFPNTWKGKGLLGCNVIPIKE